MKKTSHKKLVETGKRINGISFSWNPYTFENAVHYFSRLEEIPEGSFLCGADEEKINSVIRNLRADFPGSKGCIPTQLYYSAGVYGNSGQLYSMEILDSNYEKTGNTFYIYF